MLTKTLVMMVAVGIPWRSSLEFEGETGMGLAILAFWLDQQEVLSIVGSASPATASGRCLDQRFDAADVSRGTGQVQVVHPL